MNSSIAELLRDVLGEYEVKNKGNLAFTCPFCKHYKKKLEIHTERQQWNCWVCGTKGKTLFSLFTKLKVQRAFFIRLNEIAPGKFDYTITPTDIESIQITLPEEFTPLWVNKGRNFYYRTAISYLTKRGISQQDILKYRLGYCEGGRYDGMIIIPNYNKDGKLTYHTNRSFLQGNYKKFINPEINKNIVGFELQLNWDEPLTIVESALDAIVLKNNATPLYGKIISEALKIKILENEVEHINICLDPDASKASLEHCEYFISNGINVNFVQLPEGHDPSSLGYKKSWQFINKSRSIGSVDIFENKVRRRL